MFEKPWSYVEAQMDVVVSPQAPDSSRDRGRIKGRLTAWVILVFATATVALVFVVRSAALLAAPNTMLPNGWHVTPAGAITPLGTLPLHMLEDSTGRWLAVTTGGYGALAISIIDEQSGKVTGSSPISGAFYGLAFAGSTLYASTANGDSIARFKVSPDTGSLSADGVLMLGSGDLWVSGIAAASDGRTLYAAEADVNALVAVDARSRDIIWSTEVGSSPYAVTLSKDGSTLYVSNWAAGSVSVVDAKSGKLEKNIAVSAHPNAELLSHDGKTLYVAGASADSVSQIDTASNTVRSTIDAGIYPHAPAGALPNGLALSQDGSTLFVADAGENAVAAVDLAASPPAVFGAIPTGWYPTDVAVSNDGTKLFVLDGKGVSGHANPMFSHADVRPPGEHEEDRFYVASLATGDVEMLALPNHDALVTGLKTVRVNAAYPSTFLHDAGTVALPKHLHVIYVIKENRTYDEVLGDDPRGNGDPRLAIFGRRITPNIHRLARSFVLLDNFDTDAAVSADGHNWSTAAYASDWVEKLWPPNYSGRRPTYDFEQEGPASPPAGYLWDSARRSDVSLRDYGEFIKFGGEKPFMPSVSGLAGLVDTNYRGFNLRHSDQERIDEWLREFRGYVKDRNLPQLEIVRLPNDHTAATRPGSKTPYAMVADNDYALGRLVDAVSHSRYWRDTVIFSVEDDAQAGPDHVSDHRAEALVIGARVKRGFVDHTHYTTSSVLRTIELILDMPPMTQFDAGAKPMNAVFTKDPDLRPWAASAPLIDLNTVNPTNPDGKTSQSLNLAQADAADPATVNSILWRYATAHKLHK